jgi:hypothetical protein
LAPFRKGQKVHHLYRKFGPFEDFFAKKIWKKLTKDFSGNKNYLLAPFELPG